MEGWRKCWWRIIDFSSLDTQNTENAGRYWEWATHSRLGFCVKTWCNVWRFSRSWWRNQTRYVLSRTSHLLLSLSRPLVLYLEAPVQGFQPPQPLSSQEDGVIRRAQTSRVTQSPWWQTALSSTVMLPGGAFRPNSAHLLLFIYQTSVFFCWYAIGSSSSTIYISSVH